MANNYSTSPASRKQEVALVVAPSESFAAFEQWMDTQLEQLVARWIHAAAPNLSKFDRVQQQFGRKPKAK